VRNTGFKSLVFAGGIFWVIMAFWFVFGLAQKRAQHRRGNTLVPWRQLVHLLKRKREASDLTLGKLPLVKHKETSHILITGTTGSGKTNAFHILLPQIRKRKNRAVILDITGDYVSRYYNETTDIILNPLDTRSKSWHPWIDCHLDSHYDVLAESFIQTKVGARDPFWDNASRAVLKTALRKFAYQGNTDIQKMITFLMNASDKEFEDFFQNTEAATFTFKNNEKTTNSIRSVLSSQIEALRQLESTNQPFSLRDWVQKDTQLGWLFITARADQRQTLTPLISAWMDITINALMILSENQHRRLWFVIDELAALQKLPRLQAGLAEGRKYGGCLLVGFQSKPQLEEIYGRQGTEAMLDLFNTKVFFRCTEPSTQAWIAKVLGDKEEAEHQENISYGAHSMRDGVSLSRHTRQKPLVMPSEFSQLNDLECYVKLPGDYPCTKLQTKYQKPSNSQKPAFLLKPEKKRDYGVLSNLTSSSNSSSQGEEISCTS
jgi:type IV conjugative transfer system coupling protein TraD